MFPLKSQQRLWHLFPVEFFQGSGTDVTGILLDAFHLYIYTHVGINIYIYILNVEKKII